MDRHTLSSRLARIGDELPRLTNAILAKSDRTQQLMSQNYEENDRETIVRTRGIQ